MSYVVLAAVFNLHRRSVSLMHQVRYSSEAILDMSSLPVGSAKSTVEPAPASNLSGMTVSNAAKSLAFTCIVGCGVWGVGCGMDNI
jgi:hypothetical protein